MDIFKIIGGQTLQGEVTPSGNKNAALPLLAACLLTEEPVVLHNVPQIQDVETMGALLQSLGVSIIPLDTHTWQVQAKEVRPADLDPDLTRRIRASILLAGPMVARAHELRLPPPGGDGQVPRGRIELPAAHTADHGDLAQTSPDAARRDAPEESRFAQTRDVVDFVDGGLGDDTHTEAGIHQHASDDGSTDKGAVDIGITGDQDHIERVPAPVFEFFSCCR